MRFRPPFCLPDATPPHPARTTPMRRPALLPPALLLAGLLLGALCAPTRPALAAFASSSDAVPLESVWNPRPDKDDIVLPMPCGLSMAFRAISVPAGSLIEDRTFAMGVVNAADGERQIYERQFDGHIAAPFTRADLPEAWRRVLPAQGSAGGDTVYFIGKYEVSRAQWQAVMDALNADGDENPAACPAARGAAQATKTAGQKPDQKSGQKSAQKSGQTAGQTAGQARRAPAGSNLPETGISWFDAQEFLQKYNAWLARHHAASLPRFAGTQNIGFVRLPTEEEWEYAARGGARVPPEWWADRDVFPLEDGKSLRDYAVFSGESALSAPAPIGSRNANPLGLHDTAGNARELVDGFFRLSVADMRAGAVQRRLHGAAGGMLSKGGGFRGDEAAMAPGRRDEVPLYTATGPSRPADLGLRLVIAGLNIPNAQRLELLRTEERTPAKAGGAGLKARTPLEAVAELAEAAPALKPRLDRLGAMLEDQNEATARERAQNLEREYRSLLYQAETLRAFAFRYSAAHKQREKVRALMRGTLDAATRAQAEKLLAEANSDLKDYLQSLEMGAGHYKNGLALVSAAEKAETDRLAARSRQEYGGKGVFDTHMRQNVDTLEQRLAEYRARGASGLSARQILRGILPEQHFKLLPL